jgi:prepilin-type N-terminal cleavage/methylation domain-containing protein
MSGFTLVELLVVMGIIVILISILIPAVAKVRGKAQDAATRAWMAQLGQAIDQYNADFRSYPGPLSNDEIWTNNGGTPANVAQDTTNSAAITAAGFLDHETDFEKHVTMSENLVLGLLGGLRFDTSSSKIVYDPRSVGSGAATLTARPGKRAAPYLEAKNLSWRLANNLKTGKYQDGDGQSGDDSFIPEFVDSYPDPMPILYLRARKGARQIAAGVPNTPEANAIVTWDANDAQPRVGAYDLHQIIAYTKSPIGSGKKVTPVGRPPTVTWPHGLSTVDPAAMLSSSGAQYQYPYDAYPYFRNQTASTPSENSTDYSNKADRNDVPRQKDGYILISAGLDHVYGTADDVTNFGAVSE